MHWFDYPGLEAHAAQHREFAAHPERRAISIFPLATLKVEQDGGDVLERAR